MQASGRDMTTPDWFLAYKGFLSSVIETVFFLAVLMLSILFILLALSYLRTYFRSRLEAKIASRRTEKGLSLPRPAPGKSAQFEQEFSLSDR